MGRRRFARLKLLPPTLSVGGLFCQPQRSVTPTSFWETLARPPYRNPTLRDNEDDDAGHRDFRCLQ